MHTEATHGFERASPPVVLTNHPIRCPRHKRLHRPRLTAGGWLRCVAAASLVIVLGLAVAAPSRPAQAAVCSEIILNGNMEGSGGWQINPGSPTPAYSTAQAHSPTRSMQMGIFGGDNQFSFSSVTQDFVLPANTVSATLTWWAWTQLTAAGGNDYQELLLQDSNSGSTLSPLWRVQENSLSWNQQTRDISSFRGRNLRLFFNVRNDGVGGAAGMFADDVSLVVCVSDTPTPGSGGQVAGQVFVDSNGNGLPDRNEFGFPGLPVTLTPGSTRVTDGNGGFDFGAVPGGSYSVSITPPPGYVATTASSVGITVAGGPVIVNFGIQLANTSTVIVVTATPTPTPIVVTATPTPTPVVVTATPTPTPNIIIWTATPTPTPGIIVVTATPTPTPGIIVVTATPTPIVVTNTPLPTLIVVTNTATPLPPPPTPTGTPVPPGCSQWVQNPSFEEPLMLIDPGWVIFRQPLMPTRVPDPNRTGTWSVRMGTDSVDARSFSSIRQELLIPINATKAELSWWWWARGDPGDKNDYQELLLMTPSWDPHGHQVIAQLWPRNQEVSDGWREGKADLMPFRGFNVVLYFNVYNNGDGQRRVMFVDDVTISGCVPEPTPTPAPPTDTPVPGVATPLPGEAGSQPETMPTPETSQPEQPTFMDRVWNVISNPWFLLLVFGGIGVVTFLAIRGLRKRQPG